MAEPDDEEGGGAAPAAGAGGTVPIGSTEMVPETTPAPSGPDFTSMVRPPADMAALNSKLSEIQRAKTASNAAAADETMRRLEVDRGRMEAAYKASAVMPEELKSGWDAKAKQAEHSTDAVTAFGSIGSVFAMLASSFAGLPMEHALNAGAAAINAVHAGDAKAYDKEFEAWKANTDLALKRHNIMRQSYNDATNLMNSNINAGRTKMELAAAKYGDQKAQALLDAGMDKELFQLFADRNKTALEMQSQWDKVQLEHEKVQDLRSRPGYADPATRGAAVQEWSRDWAPGGRQTLRYDFVKDYIDTQKRENPGYTAEDLARWGKEAATAQEGETAATGGTPSSGKLKSAAIQEIVDNAKAEGKPVTIAEATAQYNRKVATPSGNRIDDIEKAIGMFDNGKASIDKTLAMIDKHWGSVGVAGYATRGGERLGNIFGSNETDRSQVAHEIKYLQTIAPRLLQDASSRGLKAEADKINSIIAGLNIGDTTANTKRALTEVRELWDKMQRDNINRRDGRPNAAAPPGESAPASPPAGGAGASGSKKAPWLNDPVVKPRAELESETAYG
mgnify:CR=1 FL=1